jgi:hypothetical protein
MITCSFTMLAAPTCVAGLDPDLATVVVHVDEPAGTFAAGLCRSPATFLGWGTTTCSDGSSNHAQFLNAGTAATLVLPAGTYTGVLGSFATASLGTTGPVTLVAGQSTDCTFTMDAAPACSIDDGDGVDEDPLADGNDDGIPDAEQAWVTTFTPATGGAPVTVVAPDDTHTITAVTSAGLPHTPDPPSGASLPIGVLGFTVTLPGGASTADVDVILPPDTNPTSYFKLQGGAWADFTSHTTIVGDTVTLHLVDGDPFDADGDVNGVIVDPGFPSRGFRFDGFDPPIANHAVNAANAGQSIPVKWRVSRADGSPVSETADIVGLTSNGGPCAGGPVTEVGVSAPGVSGLTYRGNGEWHVNWKTAKAFKGHCRTLSLTLGDGTVHTADFTFK